jgi:DNA (cytosine-5)-methyltransferase 1
LVGKYLDNDKVYLSPNMTYKTRLIQKPPNTITNGSVAILIPKRNVKISKSAMEYFSTDQYRHYMEIARNYQTRTLNIDENSVFFYGVKKEATDEQNI